MYENIILIFIFLIVPSCSNISSDHKVELVQNNLVNPKSQNNKNKFPKIHPLKLERGVQKIKSSKQNIELIRDWDKIEPINLSDRISNGTGTLFFDKIGLRKLEIKFQKLTRQQHIKQTYYIEDKRIFHITKEITTTAQKTEDKNSRTNEYPKFHYLFFDKILIRDMISYDCLVRNTLNIDDEIAKKHIEELKGLEILSTYDISLKID